MVKPSQSAPEKSVGTGNAGFITSITQHADEPTLPFPFLSRRATQRSVNSGALGAHANNNLCASFAAQNSIID